MSGLASGPRLLKGGLVLVDAATSAIQRVVVLQYNPETLSRTLQVQAPPDTGDRSEALRLLGPPVESIKLDAEIDAADQLEQPDRHPTTSEFGISPFLAALETIVYPPSAALLANNALADAGTLEILPVVAPLTLFVWSKSRVVPVRLTDFSVTEEAFDPALNPIRAKVSLGMRVLSIADLGFDSKGGSLYLVYQQTKERLAAMQTSGALGALGIGGL
jgi:hypothetical protein